MIVIISWCSSINNWINCIHLITSICIKLVCAIYTVYEWLNHFYFFTPAMLTALIYKECTVIYLNKNKNKTGLVFHPSSRITALSLLSLSLCTLQIYKHLGKQQQSTESACNVLHFPFLYSMTNTMRHL